MLYSGSVASFGLLLISRMAGWWQTPDAPWIFGRRNPSFSRERFDFPFRSNSFPQLIRINTQLSIYL